VELKSGVTITSAVVAGEVAAAARADGEVVFELSAGSKEEFFAAVRTVLPQDPPLGSVDKWDAASDSVSGGFLLLAAESALVVCLMVAGCRRRARRTSRSRWGYFGT
jgi:hypothetical protein